MIRLVSFDIWGTLVAAPPNLHELLARHLAEQTGGDPSNIAHRIRTMGREFDRTAIRSGRDIPSLEKLLQLARAVGVSDPLADVLHHEVKRHLESAPPYLIEPAACRDLWLWLQSRGIEIAFASNSGFISGELMRGVLASLGLLHPTTRCVFSDELGVAKPSAEFFRQVAGEHDPATVLHVGDSADSDIAGATDAGMSALHYLRTGTPVDHVTQIGSISLLPSLIEARWATGRPDGEEDS
jgi:FMN phosphatase YigB (HAD superfamily)